MRHSSQSKIPGGDPQPDHSGLQVVSDPTLEVKVDYGKIPTDGCVSNQPESTIVTTDTSTGTLKAENDLAVTDKKTPRRKYAIFGVVIGMIVIIAAVLGGVFGSRKVRSDSNPSQQKPSSSSSPSATLTPPMPTPTAVAAYSHLAATAWRTEEGFTRLLFYQDSNGTLRYSLAAGSGSLNQSSWGNSMALSPQYPVKNMTGIGTAVFLQRSGNTLIQLEIFYLNQTSAVNALNFARPLGFSNASLNEKKYQAMEGSDLASYWPFTVFQSLEGILQVVFYSPWQVMDLKIGAMSGTRLALIPTSRNFTHVKEHGRWAIFYQDKFGKLVAWEDPAKKGADDTYTGSSKDTVWNSTFPDIMIPDKIPSIAAFSVASPEEGSVDSVNTYVLYQDISGVIQQIWRDGVKNEWRTTTPDAFDGADKGSSIACVTTPMWVYEKTYGERLLEPTSDLTHCYFMRSGSVIEVQFDGTDWKGSNEIKI